MDEVGDIDNGMRILHVANFSWFSSKQKRNDNIARYYATDRKISNGLIRNGHCLWDFSYRDAARYLSPLGCSKTLGAEKMNRYLLAIARQFAPDVILLGHCELLTVQTLQSLRAQLPACKIGQWWVDPFTDRSLSHLREKQPYLDAFFATSSPAYYRSLLDNGYSLPSLFYLPNSVDASIESERAFERESHRYDLFFAGATAPERTELLQQLIARSNIRCGFFGFEQYPTLGGYALVETIGHSKMGLNLSRAIDIPLYSSDRIAQLTGNGCLTLTPRSSGMTTLFADDEVVYYDNHEHLLQQLDYYHNNDDRRRQIAERGWQRVHQSYNEKRITQFMLEALTETGFSEPYEWLEASTIPVS